MHRLLARRLAALVLTTLLALSVGHVLFNGGLERMSWGAAAVNTPAQTVGAMMHERVPVDLQLIIGGMLLGTFLGIVAGCWCAA